MTDVFTDFNKGKGKLHCSHFNGTITLLTKSFHLNGFPPGHKFHKKGERAGNKNKRPSSNNTQLEIPTLIQEQYQQILALLNDGNAQPKANVTGQIIPLCLSSHTRTIHSNKWVINSSETVHITPYLNLLQDTSTSLYSSVALPDGHREKILSTGSVSIGPNLAFPKTFNVPSFCVNLLSVRKMTK